MFSNLKENKIIRNKKPQLGWMNCMHVIVNDIKYDIRWGENKIKIKKSYFIFKSRHY